ncbi:MAG: TetR/AcrR family transcriptional regulator [Rhodoferax sp.]
MHSTTPTAESPAAQRVQARKLREAQARREHILAVVKALVKAGGARSVSLRRVAQEAGFSTTVVYSLFPDKATLITRAMDADLLALVAAMRGAAAQAQDPAQRLRLAAQAYVRFGLEHPDEYALVFMEPRPHAPVEAALVEHGNAEQDPYAFACELVRGYCREVLGWCADALESAQVHLLTQLYWQGLHGLVSLHIVMGPDDPWAPHIPVEDKLTAYLDVVLAGLAQGFGRR